jgi:hypothetical protein
MARLFGWLVLLTRTWPSPSSPPTAGSRADERVFDTGRIAAVPPA